MKPGDAAALARYVLRRSPQYRLDPNAVIAVAIQEGLSGHIGDNGTSFGPWQLHQGGAYPSSAPQTPNAANAWAWSPAGVDYALGRMSTVAGGLKGRAAVHAIVYRFERPSDPASEYSHAIQALPASDGGPAHTQPGAVSAVEGVIAGQVAGAAGTVKTLAGVPGDVAGAAGAASSIAGFLGKLADPRFWIRALEIVGGGIILMLGLYLLARRAGLAPSPSTAAALTPQGRAAKLAGAASLAVPGE